MLEAHVTNTSDCETHKWLSEHIMRKGRENLERLVVVGNTVGKISRGRSPARWTDQLKSGNLVHKFHEVVRCAMDLNRWQECISAVLSFFNSTHTRSKVPTNTLWTWWWDTLFPLEHYVPQFLHNTRDFACRVVELVTRARRKINKLNISFQCHSISIPLRIKLTTVAIAIAYICLFASWLFVF